MSYPGPVGGAGRPRPAPPRAHPPGERPGQSPGQRPGRAAQPPDAGHDLDRREVEATLAAQRELGPDMQDALVDSFADKVERAIELRVAGEVARHAPPSRPDNGGRLALAIVSAAVGVPLTAICAGTALGLPGLLIVWVGLVLVNLGFSRRR